MKDNGKKKVKGIKIQNVNICMMVISCILYIILIFVTVYASKKYNVMISAMENYILCEEDAVQVREGSDFLTNQVRMYTVTKDIDCLKAYFEEVYTVKRRDKAIEEMKNFQVSEEEFDYLQRALDNSNDLMEREIYAMKLIAVSQKCDMNSIPADVRNMELTEEDEKLSQDDMIEKARDMVFGSVYQEKKEEITKNVTYFLNGIVDSTLQRQRSSVQDLKHIMTEQRILISVLFVENIFTFFLIIILVIKPLKIYIENIEGKEKLNITGSYEFKYLALTYNNIYELNAANEAMLHYQAEHDPLTGIINRGAFEKIKQLLRMKKIPLGLMIVDVDKFKLVNDGYGHETGDKVLKKVAKLLEENFRSTDYPARIGGDEFAVILTEATPDMKSVIGQKINNMNEILMNPSDGLPQVSLSVGIAFSARGFTEDLYNKADFALYQVKENGRCDCIFYEEKTLESDHKE